MWLLVVLFFASVDFPPTHFVHCNIALCCCRFFVDIISPFRAVLCAFCTLFFFVFWLLDILLLAVSLVLSFYFFFQVFLLFLFCFHIFLVVPTFLALDNLLVLTLFLCFLAHACSSCCLWMYGGYLGAPNIYIIPPKCSVTVMWYHTMLVAISHTHMLVSNMSCSTINESFCLVLRLLRAHASPYTHPNPSQPCWVLHWPFMSRRT